MSCAFAAESDETTGLLLVTCNLLLGTLGLQLIPFFSSHHTIVQLDENAMNSNIVLRPVIPEQMYPCWKLGIDSHTSYRQPPTIQWPRRLSKAPTRPTNCMGRMNTASILIAELNGQPIGAMQIIDPHFERTHYWGEIEPNLRAIDIWIGEPDCLGMGYGETMMRLALQRCFANPRVSANCY